MSETYFSKFPIITYENYQIRNIAERAVVVTKAKIAPFDYFPYELGNNLRPDQLANAYYGDPTLDWMIYIVNDIVDPYYGWHLYDLDFDDYIIQKYGDLGTAQQTIAFWRTNWPIDTRTLTVDAFGRQPDEFKKYWVPVWGKTKGTIIGYSRRQDDTTVNTNKIVQYTITAGTGTISEGDLVAFNYTTTFTGQGEVVTANSTTMILKNVYSALGDPAGNTTAGTINLLSNNDVFVNITNAVNLVEDITELEGSFWEPVSYYDVENEANTNKRFIDLLGDNVVFPTSESIRKALIPSS